MWLGFDSGDKSIGDGEANTCESFVLYLSNMSFMLRTAVSDLCCGSCISSYLEFHLHTAESFVFGMQSQTLLEVRTTVNERQSSEVSGHSSPICTLDVSFDA